MKSANFAERGCGAVFGAGGGTLVHTHFSLREISKTADRGGAGHPWARFPCCALTPLLWAINGKEVQKLPTTAALCPPACGFRARGPDGSRAVVLWCWCLRCGAGAVVPALWCWCCGACAVVLVPWCWCRGAARRVACTVSVYPDWLYPAPSARAYAAPAGALPMAPAQAHKPRVVAALEVVLGFPRNAAQWRLHQPLRNPR